MRVKSSIVLIASISSWLAKTGRLTLSISRLSFHFYFQVFCVKVTWSDGTVNLVYRRYREFLHLQVCLETAPDSFLKYLSCNATRKPWVCECFWIADGSRSGERTRKNLDFMLLFYTPLTQLPASTFVLETKRYCFLRTFWRFSRQTMPIARRIEVRPRIYFRCLQWNYKELKVILAKLVITFTLHFICLTRWMQWLDSKTTFDSRLQTWEQYIQPSLRRGLSICDNFKSRVVSERCI